MSFVLYMQDYSKMETWLLRKSKGEEAVSFKWLWENRSEDAERIYDWLKKIQSRSMIVNAREERSDFSLVDPFGTGLSESLFSGNLIGFFRDEEGTLEIGSRFDEIGKPPYFFFHMLAALQGGLKLNDSDVSAALETPISELVLVFFFASMLKQAAMRGFYRRYVRFERNDSRLRGSIDVARQIRENLGLQNGKLAYSYRELTADNPVNHLILHAYASVRKRFPALSEVLIDRDRGLSEFLTRLRFLAPGSRTAGVRETLGKTVQPMNDPLFPGYESLRTVCRMILRYQSAAWNTQETDHKTQGIFYYVPDLWEQYLEARFQALPAQSRNYSLKTQYEVKSFGTNGLNGTMWKNIWYPDFVFFPKDDGPDSRPQFFADAKFKPSWAKAHNGKLDSNLFEDYNKCLRDMVSLNLDRCGVIFPVKSNSNVGHQAKEHRISEFSEKCFYTIPVPVPASSADNGVMPYSEWRDVMDQSVDEVLNNFPRILTINAQRQTKILK